MKLANSRSVWPGTNSRPSAPDGNDAPGRAPELRKRGSYSAQVPVRRVRAQHGPPVRAQHGPPGLEPSTARRFRARARPAGSSQHGPPGSAQHARRVRAQYGRRVRAQHGPPGSELSHGPPGSAQARPAGSSPARPAGVEPQHGPPGSSPARPPGSSQHGPPGSSPGRDLRSGRGSENARPATGHSPGRGWYNIRWIRLCRSGTSAEFG